MLIKIIKIEVQSVAVPPSEVPASLRTEELTTEPTTDIVDPDGVLLSKEEDLTLDLVNNPAIVNIGNINESADSPFE